MRSRRLVAPQGGWWKGLGSAYFDGVDDCIVGTMPLSGGQDWSVAVTLLPRRPAASYNIAVCFGTLSGHNVAWIGTSVGVIRAGTWAWDAPFGPAGPSFRRVVITYSNGLWRGYCNGVRYPTIWSRVVDLAGTALWLGAAVNGTYFSPYWMHDVRMWSRRLSEDEVVLDQSGEYITDGLVRHLPLEEMAAGTTPELITGTPFAVTGAVIDAAMTPFAARAVAPARSIA